MPGSAWREGIGDGEQRGEHQQPDNYGPPMRRWQGPFREAPPDAVVMLMAQVVNLQRTATRAFSTPAFKHVSAAGVVWPTDRRLLLRFA